MGDNHENEDEKENKRKTMSSTQLNIKLQSMENPSGGSFSSICGHELSRARMILVLEGGEGNVSTSSSSLDLELSGTWSISKNRKALVEEGDRTSSSSSLRFTILERSSSWR